MSNYRKNLLCRGREGKILILVSSGLTGALACNRMGLKSQCKIGRRIDREGPGAGFHVESGATAKAYPPPVRELRGSGFPGFHAADKACPSSICSSVMCLTTAARCSAALALPLAAARFHSM